MIEFLLDRIAEDEAKTRYLLKRAQDVRAVLRTPKMLGLLVPGWNEWPDVEAMAARALAECRVKRELVEIHGLSANYGQAQNDRTLRAMCSVYEDHPDYDNRWAVQ